MSGRSVDFAIIGAQKAGSTFLQDGLAEHPEIFVPHDEVPFFDKPTATPEDEGFWPYFQQSKPGQRLGFKRPNLLASPGAPERLAERFPALKLIAILRDPTERLVSAYYHYMRSGFVPVRPIGPGLSEVLRNPRPGSRESELLDFSLYGRHLRTWLNHFDRDRIEIVILEEREDQRVTLARLAAFVDANPALIGEVPRRRMRGTYSLARLRIWRAAAPLIYRYGEDRDSVSPRHRLLLAGMRRLDEHLLSRIWPDDKPSLPADVVDWLAPSLEADRAVLESILGRAVTVWSAPQRMASPE